MASNKRKQDEKHLKMLREMVALPSNKTCFDCHQRGPTYVNMTIGSFVCTSCSGILRGLNPPHRVKSISMASFTPEEMEFLKSHGNELNRKVYLGLYDNRSWPEPDSRDEQRVRDFMIQKYENKRFYVAPTEAMREEAKRTNEAALSKQPQTKPLRSLLGENATKLTVGTTQPSPMSQTNTLATVPVPSPPVTVRVPVTVAAVSQPVTQPSKSGSGFDLLSDLGDPFATSTPAAVSSATGGFADFSNFGSTNSAPPTHLPHSPAPAFPISSAPLQPFTSGSSLVPLSATTSASAPPTSNVSSSSLSNFSAISDKYAALADLDSTLNPAPAPTTGINWGGSEPSTGGSINWGGSGSITTSSTGSGDINWGSGASPGVSWNSNVGSIGGAQPSGGGNIFGGKPAVANPFGVAVPPALTQTGGMPAQPNPFGTGVSSAFGQPPASSISAFGQPPSASAATAYGYQQFPVQNGGFGMVTSAGGFPGSAAAPTYGGTPQGYQAQPGMVAGFGMQPGIPQGFGTQPGFGSSWGQTGVGMTHPPTSANPFMVGMPPPYGQ